MEWDIPNWVTLVAELAFGLFISIYLYKLQEKANKSEKNILDRIKEYVIEQQKVSKSIKLASLGGITTFLDMTRDLLRGDLQELATLTSLDSQMQFVNQRLFGDTFYRHNVELIERESNVVRPFITADLYGEIQNIVARIKLLCGMHPHVLFEQRRVEEWRNISTELIPQMEELRQKILQMLMKENPELVPSEENPST